MRSVARRFDAELFELPGIDRRRRVGGGWSPRAVRSSGLWGQTRLGGSQVPDGQPTGAAMGHRDAVVAWSGVDRTGVEPLFARTH